MPSISIDTGDLADTGARFKAAGAKARTLNTAAVRKTTMDGTRIAKGKAPVDTGFMRGSIHGTTTSGGAVSVGQIAVGAHYSVYVEYGTCRMAPQPFMRPAGVAAGLSLVRAAEQIPRLALA